ncbi:MAG: aminotransferase class V-fold PLP-dependent enzyme [Acidobacteria bacterium]|mgnify:CR=1 FL=1|jgi:kynureninase|nr:aminotransferase class V-fold PLP-dependent enzyme [Acidobacteriota bacterium]
MVDCLGMDPLLAWRSEFPIVETCTYLVSHSLGAMPRRTEAYLSQFAREWGTRGVQAWYEGWWEIGRVTGDLLAPTIGAAPGTISMHQNSTVAQSIVASCFSYAGPRRRIIVQDLDFPSNHYLFNGFARYGAEVVTVPSDDGVRGRIDRVVDAIDERTALVNLSLVLFRSAHLQDVAPVIERAHTVGARVVLDLYQAAGAVPIDLTSLGADFAVGGSVKWLCGGPGAGYLYVRPDVMHEMQPAVVGWAGHGAPFDFETGPIAYADGVERFQSGTPNVPSLYSARAGYEIVAEIGVPAIREKSLRLTRRLMDAAVARGWRLNTPDGDHERGASVVIDVPNGAAVVAGMTARKVIVDYRPDAGVRVAPHFYNTEAEIDLAVETMASLAGAV